jgi:tetratricopeptide (TPR) repeat protein
MTLTAPRAPAVKTRMTITMTSFSRTARVAPLRTFVALFLAVAAPGFVFGQAQDRVRLVTGVEVTGKIVAISPNGIDIEDRSGTPKKLPIDSIREVRFDGEPDSLRTARGMLLRKDGAGALEELTKIEPSELEGASPEIQGELKFVRAAATARRALMTGEGLPAAQKAMVDYLAAYPRTHNLYVAQELLGDVLGRLGKYDEAVSAYDVLDKGPPSVEIRSATSKARLLYQQKKYAEALREFDAAAKVDVKAAGSAGARAKLDADLGRARCLIRLGKAGDAVSLVQGILNAADATDSEALGRAYNVLGDAQRAAGDNDKDALIAFLTVDIVHSSVPDDHAEALYNLIELWEKTNNPERARDARQELETTYPDSPWARKAKAAKPS